MNKNLNLIGLDYGASSGRGIAGIFDGKRLSIKEFHRFNNTPVKSDTGMLEWDFVKLFSELIIGLQKYAANISSKPDSMGIDTWGVDFGFLDLKGKLIQNPMHYRNFSTSDLLDDVFEIIKPELLFNNSGIAFYTYTSLFQLYRIKKSMPDLIREAESLLMIPDLLIFLLTGIKGAEITNSSTTGLLNLKKMEWNTNLISVLGIKGSLFAPLYSPGIYRSNLSTDVLDETNLSTCRVIATATHDTASAVLSVPTEVKDFAYLSSGTWSLIGIEIESPILADDAMNGNYTNERGAFGEFRFLKNIMGLWIVQECKRDWEAKGIKISFDKMESLAEKAHGLNVFIDPDHPVFYKPGRMIEKINAFCTYTGQNRPVSEGAIIRCILESLAFAYRQALDDIVSLSAKEIECLHIVGGGARNILLNQFTANALGIPVYAGPVEATTIGNLAVQLKAHGEVSSKDDIRRIVRDSFSVDRFLPENTSSWNSSYEVYKEIQKKGADFPYEE